MPEMYGRFLVDLFTLWFEDLKRGSQPYIRQFENYIGILLGYEPESCEQRGFCESQNVVEADGSVYPCDFYVRDEYKLGNLNEDLLPTIHENRRKIGYLERSRHQAWTDGRYTYFRAAKEETSQPLYIYTAMPTVLRQVYGGNDAVNTEDYKRIEMGRFLP